MKLESADNHEARTMPDAFNTVHESAPRHKLSWRAKARIEHDNRWETDPEYRQNCIENEVEFQRRKEKDLHY